MRRGFLCGAAAGVATAIRTKKGGVCTGGPAPPAAPPTHSGGVQGLGMAADGLPPRRPPGPPCGYRASRRSSRAVRRPSRRASRPARRPSRRASRPSRRAARRSCPAVWASASVTSAGLIATNPPNAAASPSRENAPRRDIIFVLLIVKLPGYTTMSYIGPRYTRKRCGAPLCKNRSSGAWARLGRRPPGRGRNELTHPPTTFDQPFRPRAPRPGLDEALGGGLGSSQKGALRSCPLEVMNSPPQPTIVSREVV